MYRNTPAQRGQDPACRHSKEAFHCLFCVVASRRDISFGAKLLHALLVSQHRLQARWTQAELAERIGAPSRQAIWRLTRELEAAGLLVVRRVGLQMPNEYTVLGVADEDLDGTRPRPTGHQEVRPRASLARAYSSNPKENEIRTDYSASYYSHPFYGRAAFHEAGG